MPRVALAARAMEGLGTMREKDPFRLDGEIAVITGGGTGLGLAHARCMTRAGARVVLVGRSEAPLAEAVAQTGGSGAYFVHDITDFDAAPGLVARITERVGSPTILINNAGNHLKKPALDTTVDDFNAVFRVHVLGAMALTQAVLPGMIERGRGSILFTGSMNALLSMPMTIAYGAAKAAYTGLVRTLTAEFAPHGVRVNGIIPGWIETPMLEKALSGDPQRKAKILGRTPMARFGTPDDIGNAAVYLCSDAAKFLTGVLLTVDGGASSGF